MLISCSFPPCLSKFDSKVIEAILNDKDSSITIKENLCIGLAKKIEAQSTDKKGSLAYYLKALAFRMNALNYEGEYTGNFMHLIKPHGKGKLTLQNGKTLEGRFIDGKI